jgi:hypothetical protein
MLSRKPGCGYAWCIDEDGGCFVWLWRYFLCDLCVITGTNPTCCGFRACCCREESVCCKASRLCPNRCRQEWRDEQIAEEEAAKNSSEKHSDTHYRHADKYKALNDSDSEEGLSEVEEDLEVSPTILSTESEAPEGKLTDSTKEDTEKEDVGKLTSETSSGVFPFGDGTITAGSTVLLIVVVLIGLCLLLVTVVIVFVCFRLAMSSSVEKKNSHESDDDERGGNFHGTRRGRKFDPRDIQSRAELARRSRRGKDTDWRSMEQDCYNLLGEACDSTQIRDAMDSSGMDDSTSCSMGPFDSQ